MSGELNQASPPAAEPKLPRQRFWTEGLAVLACAGAPGFFLALWMLSTAFFRGPESSNTLWISWAITLGVPLGLGLITGLCAPTTRWIVITALALLGSVALLAALFVTNAAGIFCLVVYASGCIPIGILGAWIGFYLRQRLLRRMRARASAVLLAFVLPFGLHAAEHAVGPARERESRAHERVLHAPLARVWKQSLLEVRDERPNSGWFDLSAPRAREASGRASRVGDEKLIRYTKGYLRVRVEHVEEEQELFLRVLEQHELESKALKLHSIRISARALDAETTAVTIEYEFTPLMTPRWYWRPLERFFGGIAVEHVFDLWQEALDTVPLPLPANSGSS